MPMTPPFDIEQAKKYASEATNAYQLSMPLLAAAQSGNRELYDTHKEKFQKWIDDSHQLSGDESWMSTDEFAWWMKGRLLLTAAAVNDDDFAGQLASELNAALTQSAAESSAMHCWALAYLQAYYAKYSEDDYKRLRPALEKSLQERVEAYQQNKESFTNVMWSLAMAVYSAGVKQDNLYYMKYIDMLIDRCHPLPSMIAEVPDNDYPAWLTAIFIDAASRVNGSKPSPALYRELEAALTRTTNPQDNMMSAAIQLGYQSSLKNSIS